MRKQVFLSFFALASFAFWGCEEDSGSESFLYKIPSEIQAYVDLYFPGQSVIQALLDSEEQERRYELLLDNLTRLEFNLDKKIIEIDGRSGLPDSVLPAGILSYVSSHYAGQSIIRWELEEGYQQIQLNNQLEIEFDPDGKFIRLDD